MLSRLRDAAQSFAIHILEQWHTHTMTPRRRWRTVVHVRRLHAVSQLRQRMCMLTFSFFFFLFFIFFFPLFFFAEATGVTERSSKRPAVSELKTPSNGISGRPSFEEINEMPVLTRVYSPATLPRLKRFLFRPVDGEFSGHFCILKSLRILGFSQLAFFRSSHFQICGFFQLS